MPPSNFQHPTSDLRLFDTQRAFDSVAADYDGPSGNNALIQRMRARAMAAVTANVPVGSSLIDLGCGTGLDAEYLGRMGYHVTATDWSPQMVERTRERIESAGLGARVEVLHLGIHELDGLPAGSFDGAYSDLGPLNCIPNLGAAATMIARLLKPHGELIASVIGRACPWEMALFAMKGDWARAGARFAKQMTTVPLNDGVVWTRYYSPREFETIFAAAGFERLSLRSLGLFVPPPYMIAFAERHPKMIGALQELEDRVGNKILLREWGDHFLMAMNLSETSEVPAPRFLAIDRR
ncbi:MAG: methyltransferase domain-containing protein [Chloroflexota bacterium]